MSLGKRSQMLHGGPKCVDEFIAEYYPQLQIVREQFETDDAKWIRVVPYLAFAGGAVRGPERSDGVPYFFGS